MKVLVIEDEHYAFCSISNMLKKIDSNIQITGPVINVGDMRTALKVQQDYDVIFVDIQLQDGLSFEALYDMDITTPVIFTTAYDEYALQAFRNNGIGYLLKPIDLDELHKAVSRALQMKRGSENISKIHDMIMELNRQYAYRKRFLIQSYDGEHIINVMDIEYITIEDNHVIACLIDKSTYRMDEYTLDSIEKELDPNLFFRANRQYIVNIRTIHHISNSFRQTKILHLKCDPKISISISKDKVSRLKEWINR